MASRKTAFSILFAVFIIGLASGMVIDRFVLGQRPSPKNRRYHGKDRVAWFTRELNLSDAQQQELRKVLEVVKTKYDSLHKEMRPKYKQIRQYFQDEFARVLNPEQKAKFYQLEEQSRNKRRRTNK